CLIAPSTTTHPLPLHDALPIYKPIADAVCAALEAERIRCWIAPRDVLPGVPYGEALIEAINESRVMLLVFSSHSNESPQVMRERSEEHTSELQSLAYLVCRLLL